MLEVLQASSEMVVALGIAEDMWQPYVSVVTEQNIGQCMTMARFRGDLNTVLVAAVYIQRHVYTHGGFIFTDKASGSLQINIKIAWCFMVLQAAMDNVALQVQSPSFSNDSDMHPEICEVANRAGRAVRFLDAFKGRALAYSFHLFEHECNRLHTDMENLLPQHMMVAFSGKELNLPMATKKLVDDSRTTQTAPIISSVETLLEGMKSYSEHFGIPRAAFYTHNRTKAAAAEKLSLTEGHGLVCLALKTAVILLTVHKHHPNLHKFTVDWESMSAVCSLLLEPPVPMGASLPPDKSRDFKANAL